MSIRKYEYLSEYFEIHKLWSDGIEIKFSDGSLSMVYFNTVDSNRELESFVHFAKKLESLIKK